MWTAGFDVMYACQDLEFDRGTGLHSIPARYGIKNSLWIARLFHFQAFIVLVILYLDTGLGWPLCWALRLSACCSFTSTRWSGRTILAE